MRTRTGVTAARTRFHWLADRAGTPARETWRVRALRDVGTVRRMLRGAGTSRTALSPASALGENNAMAALQRGEVAQLLMTRRFIETRSSSSVAASQLAAASAVCINVVAGVAAFELDLAANGIGAVLQRPSRATRHREILEA
jgi:hypothetical protein